METNRAGDLLRPRPSPASAGEGCFARHLREAIELNLERLPRYAALTGGASIPLSRRLIRAERWALPLARWLDRRARRWQEGGVPVLCAELVSMEATPAFAAEASGAPLSSFRPPRAGTIRGRILRAYRSGGFPGAGGEIEEALRLLREQPVFHAMLRHLLESALRVCNLAPEHDRRARERGLPSPLPLSRTLLALHLFSLGEAVRLDAAAAPLQARGVPILLRDVPPIAPWPGTDPPPDRDGS